MNISRKHAIIAYNFEDRVFELRAAGKNGVIVTPAGGEGQTILPTDPAPLPLRNADEIHIGDFKFKFWLAKDPARCAHSITLKTSLRVDHAQAANCTRSQARLQRMACACAQCTAMRPCQACGLCVR